MLRSLSSHSPLSLLLVGRPMLRDSVYFQWEHSLVMATEHMLCLLCPPKDSGNVLRAPGQHGYVTVEITHQHVVTTGLQTDKVGAPQPSRCPPWHQSKQGQWRDGGYETQGR